MLWLPGFLTGLLIVATQRRWPGPITLIAGSFLLFALFYLTALIFRIPVEILSAGGWLLGPFPQNGRWVFPLTAVQYSQIDWVALASVLPRALPAALIGTIALLLNATGLQLIIKRDLDINRGLIGTGLANLASVLGGVCSSS